MLLLILLLTIIQLIDLYLLLAYGPNPIGVRILMNNWPIYLADLLTFSGTEPDKLNNFLFQCHLYFHTNLVEFDMDIAKINFAMTYLTGVA